MKPLALMLALFGCNDQFSYEIPHHPFEPGSPHPDGGSSSDMDTIPLGPPLCDVPARRCAYQFAYAGSIAMPLTGTEKSVELRGDYRPGGWTQGDAMTFAGGSWQVTVQVPYTASSQYKFRIVHADDSETWVADPTNPNSVSDGAGGQNSVLSGVTCANWTCASTQIVCPQSAATGGFDWRDAVMYFVFVDRFYNGSAANDAPISAPMLQSAANWQGGDWAGVTQKIQAGYFTALGVNTLWLTVPIDNSESAGIGDDGFLYSGYHGYWPRDLTKTESRFGSTSDLQTLVTTAHQAGLKIILDYAMNHVHQDSPVYQAHKSDGWFNPLSVNGQECVCGSNVCPWDSAAKVCWFSNYLPDFNFNNSDARKFSVDNAIFWLQTSGADGLRLDAIKHIEPSWLSDLRSRLFTDIEKTSKQHVYLVGETFTGDRNLIKSFIDPCQLLDGQFDFPLRASLNSTVLERQGSLKDLASFMDSNASFYGQSVMSTFIGNHDVPRVIHFAEDSPQWSDVWAGGRERAWTNQPATVTAQSAYERVALAMTVLMTNRGVPLIYYGDEIGLAGAGDPDNRRLMAWSGYNSGQSWLLARMQTLGTVRAAHTALRHGDRTTLSSTDDTWAYELVDGSEIVYVAINRADQPAQVGGLPSGALTDALTGDKLTGPTVTVPARGARVLIP